MAASEFLSDIKNMYPPPNNIIICGKDNDKASVFGLFSNLMIKFWQSRKYFYITMSAVAAASFQT